MMKQWGSGSGAIVVAATLVMSSGCGDRAAQKDAPSPATATAAAPAAALGDDEPAAGATAAADPQPTAVRASQDNQSAQAELRSAVARFIALLESGDHQTLVDQCYAEADRFSAQQQSQLVKRLSGPFGERLLALFRQTRSHRPTVSPDGRQAMFQWDAVRLQLQKNKHGQWQFRL